MNISGRAYICIRLTAEKMRAELECLATTFNYLSLKGIPIERVENYYLRYGGDDAPLLAGYSNRDMKKMGIWRGETFKEYIREELHCFAEGMSTAMKQYLKIVNISGRAYI